MEIHPSRQPHPVRHQPAATRRASVDHRSLSKEFAMTGFYLTGSINVPTIQDAFRLVGDRLQPGVTRVPDGEPGYRANWVLTQADHFLKNPTLDVVDGRARVRAGTAVKFGPVDYHTVAADSYQRFLAARGEG